MLALLQMRSWLWPLRGSSKMILRRIEAMAYSVPSTPPKYGLTSLLANAFGDFTEGVVMNHKKLRRLYREERRQVRRRSGRKRVLGTRAPTAIPQRSQPTLEPGFPVRGLLRWPPVPAPRGGRRLHPRMSRLSRRPIAGRLTGCART
jgi:hypothetical protein